MFMSVCVFGDEMANKSTLSLLSDESIDRSSHGARVEPVLLVRQGAVLLDQHGGAGAQAHGAPHAVVGLAQVRVEVVDQQERRRVSVMRDLRAVNKKSIFLKQKEQQ